MKCSNIRLGFANQSCGLLPDYPPAGGPSGWVSQSGGILTV